MTGVRPIQLAIHGTSALTLLENVAADPDFKGVLIVGLADTMFFQPFDGYGGYVKKFDEYPCALQDRVERDRPCPAAPAGVPRFQLSPERPRASARSQFPRGGRRAEGRHLEAVRRSASTAQTWLWDRVEYDHAWRARTRWAWKGFKEKFPYTPELIAKGQARAKAAVDKIRARGGDVVFVRPPSAPELRVNEEAQVPEGERLGRPASATPGASACTSTTCRLRKA